MTVPPIKRLLRWLLVPVAAWAAGQAAMIGFLTLMIFGPWQGDFGSPNIQVGIMVAIAAFCAVLGGVFAAPSHPVWAAAWLAAGELLYFTIIFFGTWEHSWPLLLSAALGVGLASASVLLWYRSKLTVAVRRRWVLAGVAALAVAGVIFFCASYFDIWDAPEPPPPSLAKWLGVESGQDLAFHQYNLGGFIDSAELWRFHANPAQVAKLATELRLQSVAAAPPQFWAMPPYWWPKAAPVGAVAFGSPDFPLKDRGPDGNFYLLVYDSAHTTAYVWCINNF